MGSKRNFVVAATAFLSMPAGMAQGIDILFGRQRCHRIASAPMNVGEDDTLYVSLRLFTPPYQSEECQSVRVDARLVDGETGNPLVKKGRAALEPRIGEGVFWSFDVGEGPPTVGVEVQVLPNQGSEKCQTVQALTAVQLMGPSGRALGELACVKKATRLPTPR